MDQISAKIIKDSIGRDKSYNSGRIITIECEYPKFIQAEINTHRMLVKNAASSRAIPVDRLLNDNPFIPEIVGVNKPGMSADDYLDGEALKEFQSDWIDILNTVKSKVDGLKEKYNVHKQTLNRLLEPWMMSKGIITGTLQSWDHFLKLRNSQYAQPEIKELAMKIERAIKTSVPQELKEGEWHLPYVDSKEPGEDNINIKISASCIAQVSYRKLDQSVEKALDIFDKLNLLSTDVNNPPHISPVQHICTYAPDAEILLKLDQEKVHDKNFYAELGYFIQSSKFVENINKLSLEG